MVYLKQINLVNCVSCFLVCTTLSLRSNGSSISAPRVAVIGAGIGGASTAHYLRSLFGGDDTIAIDVYEAVSDRRVGGRLAVVTLAGEQYESGGSIIHPRNEYMLKFVKLLGLEAKKSEKNGRFGLYDGHQYLFVESSWSVINYLKLLWRYGFSLIRLWWFLDDMLKNFSNIYSRQDGGEYFETVDDLLSAMYSTYANLTKITARSYLRGLHFSELFIDELFTAITRVNYGQTADVNAFVGAVSLAGAQSGVWSVKDGNYQVPKRLLETAKVNLIFSKVTMITLRQDGRFDVTSDVTSIYDMVFVCTPLTANMSGINFEKFPNFPYKFNGKYQRTVATFVRGVLNTTALHMNANDLIDEIFTTSMSDVFFNSLGKNYPVRRSNGSSDVWKIFSHRSLTDTEIDSLYVDRIETRVVDWLAYPHYEVKSSLEDGHHHRHHGDHHRHHGDQGDFILHPKLYYTNCIEWAASAMEMSVIAGRNVAIMAHKHWMEGGVGDLEDDDSIKRKNELDQNKYKASIKEL